MNRWRWWILADVPPVLLSSVRTQAGPIFPYVFDKTQYNVPVGGTVNVSVLFQEIDNGASGSLPNGYLANSGLFAVGTLVDFTAQPAQVLSPGAITPNGAFLTDPTSGFAVNLTSSQALLTENVGLGSFVTASNPRSPHQITVGVFQFTGVSFGAATITVGVTGTGADDMGADGSILHNQTANGTATIVVGP